MANSDYYGKIADALIDVLRSATSPSQHTSQCAPISSLHSRMHSTRSMGTAVLCRFSLQQGICLLPSEPNSHQWSSSPT